MPELAAASWLIAYAALIVGIGAAAIRYAARPRGTHRAGGRPRTADPVAPTAAAEPPQRPEPAPVAKLYDPLDDTTLQTDLPGRLRSLSPDGGAAE